MKTLDIKWLIDKTRQDGRRRGTRHLVDDRATSRGDQRSNEEKLAFSLRSFRARTDSCVDMSSMEKRKTIGALALGSLLGAAITFGTV